MDLNSHVIITACYGGYVVQCLELEDECSVMVPYVCSDIEGVLRKVRKTIEKIDQDSAETLKNGS